MMRHHGTTVTRMGGPTPAPYPAASTRAAPATCSAYRTSLQQHSVKTIVTDRAQADQNSRTSACWMLGGQPLSTLPRPAYAASATGRWAGTRAYQPVVVMECATTEITYQNLGKGWRKTECVQACADGAAAILPPSCRLQQSWAHSQRVSSPSLKSVYHLQNSLQTI